MTATTELEISDFSRLASEAKIKRTMQSLEANNIHTILAGNGADAKKNLFEILPANAEVFTASSVTRKPFHAGSWHAGLRHVWQCREETRSKSDHNEP